MTDSFLALILSGLALTLISYLTMSRPSPHPHSESLEPVDGLHPSQKEPQL